VSKYKLFIQKRVVKNRRWVRESDLRLLFSVIDEDKGHFPFNFVCNLPKTGFEKADFSKLFPDPLNKAIEFLTTAKREYGNNNVQNEIDSRISIVKKIINDI
jgi:hypothetical protein